MLRIAFVMEQHLGHLAFFQNIQRFIEEYPDIDPTWVKVFYSYKTRLFERLSILPRQVRGTIAGYMEVRAGLKNGNFDALVFNTQVPAALAGSLLNKQPYIICTDITPIQYDQMAAQYNHHPDRPGFVSRYKHRVNTKVFRQAGLILPWSTWTQNSLINDYGIEPGRILVNSPGVDIDVWRPKDRQESKPLRVLFVGGDFYRKGGDFLLKACQDIPEGMIELVLVTRSDVPAQKWITVYNHMTPNSAELVHLYQSCDVFVLPTRAEAFGIAAAEACATGLPIITTPVGGLTDIVDDGINGFLVQPNQPDALRQFLMELAHNPALRGQMGRASRLKAELKFNARKNVSSMVDNLYKVTARKTLIE